MNKYDNFVLRKYNYDNLNVKIWVNVENKELVKCLISHWKKKETILLFLTVEINGEMPKIGVEGMDEFS